MTRHLVVAGAQRCGTTYLRTLLESHPDVAMATPPQPEPKVFLSDELTDRGVDFYHRTWFAHARGEGLYGEKSTSYLEFPEAAHRARRMLGDPLVVAQFRDPVDRAISNWKFSTQHGLEQRPIEEAFARNLDGPLPWDPSLSSVSPFAYLERGRYVDYLMPWLDLYGDRMRVQFLEEIDEASILDLCRFLEIDPAGMDLPDQAQGTVNASDGADPSLPADLETALRDYFRDSDRRLAEVLGRPVPWAEAGDIPAHPKETDR